MTEEEAKTKWCPHVRFIDLNIEGDQPCNRHGDGAALEEAKSNPKYSRCIGSACMAWRWGSFFYDDNNRRRSSNDDSGFCGLAGKP